jgi:hypothetical protein
MNQAIALLSLTAISIGLMFGNYWFTFGLWPKSWTAFALFGIASMIVSWAITAVMKSND